MELFILIEFVVIINQGYMAAVTRGCQHSSLESAQRCLGNVTGSLLMGGKAKQSQLKSRGTMFPMQQETESFESKSEDCAQPGLLPSALPGARRVGASPPISGRAERALLSSPGGQVRVAG